MNMREGLRGNKLPVVQPLVFYCIFLRAKISEPTPRNTDNRANRRVREAYEGSCGELEA